RLRRRRSAPGRRACSLPRRPRPQCWSSGRNEGRLLRSAAGPRDRFLLRSTIRRYRLIALISGLVVTTSLAAAMPAAAASGTKVIADCNSHNTLTRSYSVSQLENALRTMPADVAEYTNCRDVIQRAL